jgi:hypothetical protein
MMRINPVLLVIVCGCGDLHLPEAQTFDTDTSTDTNVSNTDDTETDTATQDDTETQSDTGMDTATQDDTETDTQCRGLADFSPCALTTTPEYPLDICVDGRCVSPGCDDAACNPPGPHFPLADTYMRFCYNDVESISCPPDGSPFAGQDAQYGWDVAHTIDQRFPVDTDTSDTETAAPATVTDLVTGLTWQTTGLWYEPWVFWEDARNRCSTLYHAGYDDWRLPDVYELMSIVNLGRPSFVYVFDAVNVFNTLRADRFWTSTSQSGLPDYAWTVNFQYGHVLPLAKSNSYYDVYAVCVRGTPTAGRTLTASTESDARTVKDGANGLVWQGCAAGLEGEDCAQGTILETNWEGALSYCASLDLGGHADWRLPDAVTLASIADYRFDNPSIHLDLFPQTPSLPFWTSTARSLFPGEGWIVDFSSGHRTLQTKSEDGAIRCVRDDL